MKWSIGVWILWLLVGVESKAETELTIYAGSFAVVREALPLDLQAGLNEVRYANVTDKLDAGTVILRDLSGKTGLEVAEQTYHAIAPDMVEVLGAYEGQTLDFLVKQGDFTSTVRGKVIRAGNNSEPSSNSNSRWADPIIEIDGKVLFRLPGTPIFPRLPENTITKPELLWKITAPKPAKLDADLTYITEGLAWSADYTAVLEDSGKISSLKGFISVSNQSGRSFDNARITVVAGDVDRQKPPDPERVVVTGSAVPTERNPGVYSQEKWFDEFHAYSLKEPVTLHNSESRQVKFMQAEDVQATRSYVYEGGNFAGNVREDVALLGPALSSASTTRISIECEFKNSKAGGLGLPLPRGRWHFFRLDTSQRLDFIGDASLQDTPVDEEVRAQVGSAFDLVGERRQVSFNYDQAKHTVAESFEIKLRNHRRDPVEIRILESPFRWHEWKLTAHTDPLIDSKKDTIEFRIPVKPGEQRVVTYTILYSHIPVPQGAE